MFHSDHGTCTRASDGYRTIIPEKLSQVQVDQRDAVHYGGHLGPTEAVARRSSVYRQWQLSYRFTDGGDNSVALCLGYGTHDLASSEPTAEMICPD